MHRSLLTRNRAMTAASGRSAAAMPRPVEVGIAIDLPGRMPQFATRREILAAAVDGHEADRDEHRRDEHRHDPSADALRAREPSDDARDPEEDPRIDDE